MAESISEKIAQDVEEHEFLVIAKYWGTSEVPEKRRDYQAVVKKIAKHVDPLEEELEDAKEIIKQLGGVGAQLVSDMEAEFTEGTERFELLHAYAMKIEERNATMKAALKKIKQGTNLDEWVHEVAQKALLAVQEPAEIGKEGKLG